MALAGRKASHKGLKICLATTIIFLLLIIAVSVTLFFTVFKPKQPQVTAHPASIDTIQLQIYPTFSLNATLGLVITINNRNYGSFKYKNTTASISYHGASIAEIPIEHDMVPARGQLNITTYANVTGEKMVSSPYFWDDVRGGRLEFSSVATLHGKVSVMKIFKLGAEVVSTCEISMVIQTLALESKCTSKIKL
ncbi:uncharacterized protein LOC127811057 [Diospyros lotus]|uniref:uncharacterized protein LOC127811057 n=1 Tax=Diospyros lotus TaxID=55363 RepID=UPI00224E9D1E|nr:uncharacterized protein LOC127811057 [Diospyros lotus]